MLAIKSCQDNRRYTMRDIGRIQRRVENIEYYTQLSLLESDAQSQCKYKTLMALIDLKMVSLVDNFTGHGVGECIKCNDYSNSMDIGKR